VFTRMLCSKNLTRWHWPLTLKINRVPDSPKDYICTKFDQNPLKDLDSSGQRSMSPGQIFTAWDPCEHSRINILQWILTKLGTYLDLTRVWSSIDFQGQGHRVKFLPHNILVNTRIKILQWILIKLGTYVVLRRVWNPIDFQGQRSMSPGQIFTA
jgi:hypothetical protein